MFGKINNEQNIINAGNYGKLLNNPKFIGISNPISEEVLFKLIKQYYDNKNKELLLRASEVYQKHEYKKYLDTIIKYNNEYK